MKLSVIIPVYNAAPFLEKLIDTITAFTFTDFECIFIDNNSADSSIATLKELLQKTSLDYLILSEEKQGAGHARNAGIKNAKGEYLAFLDCDDIILPEKFERDMEIFSNHDVDFVFCRAKRIYEDGRMIKKPIEGVFEGINSPPDLGYIWLLNYFKLPGTGALVARREIVESLGSFHTSLTGEDAFLFIRLGMAYRGWFYDEVLAHYIRHKQSTTSISNRSENSRLRRYFELRQNLYNDLIIQSNEKAIQILGEQLQTDLLKLQQLGDDIKVVLKKEIRNDLRLSYLLFNPISLFINRRVPHIKYNPFYQIDRKIFKKRRDRVFLGLKFENL
ncbi:MAG: glycosyltransferase [Aequorivita sp.]